MFPDNTEMPTAQDSLAVDPITPPVVTELPPTEVLPVEPIIIPTPETTQDVNKTTDVVSIPSVDVNEPVKKQVTLDYSSAGVKKGFLHGLKILGYYVITGVVVGAGALIARYQPDQQEVVTVVLFAIANAILAGAERWLSTKSPE
jgi:hypothetical protein